MISRSDFLGATGATLVAASAKVQPSTGARRRRVRFGANYVPTKNWWYSWGDWDRDSIRRDLHDIAALGMDHIRIQLLWPYFQPNSATVSEHHIDLLEQFLNDAGSFGLDVQVTVLDGQLSGFLFTPAWLIDNGDGHIGNIITDTKLISAEERLFAALGERIGKHPHFHGFDISNEVYWFTEPLHIKYTPAQGDAWMEHLIAQCERVAPGKFHVNGVDKWPYEGNLPKDAHAFTRQALMSSRAGAASCVHPWAGFYDDAVGGLHKKYGPLSTHAKHYAEYLVQYMQAFSADGARTVWVEEDGCSKQWMPENLIPQWAEAMVRNAASCDHLFGITWWCSHDVSTRFTGFNKLEYDLGLYTNDRKLKPLGRKIKELIAEFDRTPPPVRKRSTAIVMPDALGSDDLLPHYVWLLNRGERPQIVLESRSTDKPYLAKRGITSLLALNAV